MQPIKKTVVRNFLTWALPRIVELPPACWNQAIRNSRSIDFDTVEQVGLIVGVAFVAYLLRVETATEGLLTLPMVYLVQFIQALPLLILLVGPVYLRRARRGMDLEIEAYKSKSSDPTFDCVEIQR